MSTVSLQGAVAAFLMSKSSSGKSIRLNLDVTIPLVQPTFSEPLRSRARSCLTDSKYHPGVLHGPGSAGVFDADKSLFSYLRHRIQTLWKSVSNFRGRQSAPNPMLLQDTVEPIRVDLPEDRSYSIVFKPHSTLPVLMREHGLRPGRTLVVTDKNVAAHYISDLDTALQEDGWEPMVLVLPPGEQTKSAEHLQAIYDAGLSWGIDRKTPLVAVGGGVIGDLTGYAASTLLRGVPLVHVPTSLVAQVDSSIGGKTGINCEQGKNLIGSFYQPAFVCTEPESLYTLPRREWHSGLAEVVKHALIADATFFEWIEDEFDRIVSRDPGVVTDMVYRAAAIKARVVSQDEKEQGLRAILNFGHTFGHALERTFGYGVFTHGEAVNVGMRAALYLSRRYNRKVNHVRATLLLDRIPHPPIPSGVSNSALTDAMRTDKKRDAESLRFVLLKDIGKAYSTDTVTLSDVDAAWSFALNKP